MSQQETVQLRRISGVDDATLKLLERHFGMSLAGEHDWLDAIETLVLAGNTWLFRQGEPGDALYLLVRGRMQVWRESGDEPTLVGEVGPGESVGEVGLLTGAGRSAGVRAIRDSVLLRFDRATFEKMALKNPKLILRLASSVATRLQQRLGPRPAGARPPRTLALVALDRSPRIDAFCAALCEGLAADGRTLDLARETLGAAGAPTDRLAADEALDDRLRHWLAEQEFESRFVVYRTDGTSSPWSRYAVRQADIIVHVAEAGSDPQRRRWEADLISGPEVMTGSRRLLVLLQPDASAGISGTADWLAPRRVDFHLHVRRDRPDDAQRVLRVLRGRAIGLVLSGGAARGFAHLGAYRAMREAGMPIDWVGGASIGSVMAAPVGFDWTPEQAVTAARAAFVKGKPFSDYTLPLVALLDGRRMESLVKRHLQGNIEDMPIPFFCVAANLSTGAQLLIERGPVWKAVRASAALPGVLPPAVIDGQLVVDGAVINNMPVDVMQTKPVARVIAIELTTRKEHRVDYETVPSAWQLLGAKMRGKRGPRVPGLGTVMLKAIEVGTMARVRELGERADLLLRPDVHKFSMLSVDRFDDVVEAGYQHARHELPKWMASIGLKSAI